MALSARRTYETVGPTVRIPGKAEESDTYYPGAILAYNADGFLAVPGDNATDVPAGVYTGYGVDIDTGTLVVGAGSNPDIEVERGLVWVPYSSAAQTLVGTVIYVADDETLTGTAGSKIWGVPVVGFKTGYLLVDFANPTRVVDATGA